MFLRNCCSCSCSSVVRVGGGRGGALCRVESLKVCSERRERERQTGHTVGVHLDLVKVVVQCRAVYQSRVS